MAFGNKNRGRQKHDHEPQPLARIALTVTSMDNSDPDNPVMKVSLADGTRDTLGISADSPEIQFVMHEDHRKDGGLKGLFGKLPGAAQSQEVKEGYTFWADAIRKINDNTISGEWYGTFFGVGAQKNAGNYLPPLSATFVEAVNGLFLQGDGDCDERVVSARCHGLEVARYPAVRFRKCHGAEAA